MMSLRQRHLDSQLAAGSQRELNRSDSDSSLCLSKSTEHQRLMSSYGSKGLPIKPTSLPHGSLGRGEEHTRAPNGGNHLHDGGAWAEGVADSPLMMKKVYCMEKSASLGEINSGLAGLSQSESSRSLSQASTDPDTPSPTGGHGGPAGVKPGSRIPQLSSMKSPLEEDSGSTGDDTDSTASRKKHTFKLFKKQRK